MELFEQLVDENRFDFCKLVYIVFPFGQVGHALEHEKPYEWQMEEWAKLSRHLSDPKTRFDAYRLIISSGNGAAKTAFGAMTFMMLMYTQQLRGRITANTQPQLNSIVWPEYDIWFRYARYHDFFFEKFGTSIKAKNEELAETWRLDAVTWDENRPASISGLHNKGKAIIYIFEEAPGIPAVIWNYASGAFTEVETIKLFFAFGNSDDPESKFEQNMESTLWHSRRIDTRELEHIDKNQIADWLVEAGGDEDNDDFRVRVRGMPRKQSKDSIISKESVIAALGRRHDFDPDSVAILPAILTIDPAWTGGDECTIWYHQGNYSCLLDKYKLDKAAGETHNLTYTRACKWERDLKIDRVLVDQGEGTAIYTLATNDFKTTWELVAFAASPNDFPEAKDSQFANIRAQMYNEAAAALRGEYVINAREDAWIPDIEKQLCWTKGARHKTTMKKTCESKLEIKNRVGQSPDVADGFILRWARKILERTAENSLGGIGPTEIGGNPFVMPAHPVEELYEVDASELYGD